MRGSIRLFRLFGINVYLHFTWIIAFIVLVGLNRSQGAAQPTTLWWSAGEILTLFAIVLTHEFGHALACRSVGGVAQRIILWPFGGVAFVQAPPRPAPFLWSIAAGPLVNVALVPLTIPLMYVYMIHQAHPTGFSSYCGYIFLINLGLLIFNILPFYPLDGGQILQSLLWFFMPRSRSIFIAAIIGIIGATAIIIPSLMFFNWWMILMALFLGSQAWVGLQQARFLALLEQAPPHPVCPNCRTTPPTGTLWTCNCGQHFDLFAEKGTCPHCGNVTSFPKCPNCQQPANILAWYPRTAAPHVTAHVGQWQIYPPDPHHG